MKPFLALFTLLLAPLSASALEWKSEHASIKAVPLQRKAETVFSFTNTSDRAVTITAIDTSCDCTVATPSAKTFAPGAQGTITAHFDLTGAAGTLQRLIVVSTDEGKPATALAVELEIPDVARLTPRALEWKRGGPADEAAVDIEVTPGIELTIAEVRPTSAAFSHRLEILEAGRHFRLHIAPKDTTKAANAAFRLYAKTAGGEAVVFSAYANVR